MADADSRKERFQGNLIDREEDGVLYQRYLKVSSFLAWTTRYRQQALLADETRA